jgi:trimeric autotransporter adhesin
MNNVAVGFQAALCTTTGISNTAVGACSLRLNTTGVNNTATGVQSLLCNTTGGNNTAAGLQSLFKNTTGCNNTAVGVLALQCSTEATNNTAVGVNALLNNTTGSVNAAVGVSALFCNITGGNNIAVGPNALRNSTGSNNIGIGTNAGRTGGTPEGIVNITTESNRIVMGNDDHTCAQIKIAWTATSDCRDKTCFKPIAHGLDFVRALKPTEYQFKQGGRDSAETDGKRRYGFLAQDILPLEGDAPVIISADNPEKLQYTESHLIPILVKAIQELTARVEELENNA